MSAGEAHRAGARRPGPVWKLGRGRRRDLGLRLDGNRGPLENDLERVCLSRIGEYVIGFHRLVHREAMGGQHGGVEPAASNQRQELVRLQQPDLDGPEAAFKRHGLNRRGVRVIPAVAELIHDPNHAVKLPGQAGQHGGVGLPVDLA